MKKYIVSSAFIMLLLLGVFSACSRSAGDFYSEVFAPWTVPQVQREYRREQLGLAAPAPEMLWDEDFVFFGAEPGDAPAAAFPMTEPPTPGSAPPGTVEWEDIAGTGERHIIQTANVDLETEYFDEVVQELRGLAPAANGYVQQEMLTTHGRRMFTTVLRVPAASFEIVLRHVESLADVMHIRRQSEDVTDRFYDIIGNLEARLIEEDRVLALIEYATTIQELLSLETRLSNVRLRIEEYRSRLDGMAAQIAYSTIVVVLHDIRDETPYTAAPTLGERIGGAFGDSVDGTVSVLQNIVIFLAGVIIPVVIFVILGFVAFLLLRRAVRRFSNAHGNSA